jgi:SAM-dependent methyltransferase
VNTRFSLEHFTQRLPGLSQAIAVRLFRRRCFEYDQMRPYFAGKMALEIGGPSSIFTRNRLIPIYPYLASLDACNFSARTLWSSTDEARIFGPLLKRQFAAEATLLAGVADETHDLVLASHVLEHVANPLCALREWRRVLRPDGVMLVILPHQAATFDCRRPISTLEHLVADEAGGIAENDLTHMDEILALHDLALDPPAGTPEQFRARCLRNAEVRGMHHHVFSPELLVKVFDLLEMRVLALAVERPHHIIALAQKTAPSEVNIVRQSNRTFVADDVPWRRSDPFRSSRSS